MYASHPTSPQPLTDSDVVDQEQHCRCSTGWPGAGPEPVIHRVPDGSEHLVCWVSCRPQPPICITEMLTLRRSYLLMQIPSNLFLNKFGKPAIYLPACVRLHAVPLYWPLTNSWDPLPDDRLGHHLGAHGRLYQRGGVDGESLLPGYRRGSLLVSVSTNTGNTSSTSRPLTYFFSVPDASTTSRAGTRARSSGSGQPFCTQAL